MAQRFGGRYSPGTGPATPPPDSRGTPAAPPPNLYDGKRPARGGARLNLLYAVALVPALRGFFAAPGALVLGIAASALILAAALLTREGLRAEAAFDLRKIARRPALPRKMLGAVLTGAGVAMAAQMSMGQPLMAALLGLTGAALHLGAFGLDPLRDKGAAGIDSFQTERVARAVDEAETYLAAMKDAILRARDRSLETRVDRFATAARALFRSVEADPGDLTAARKYLGVYLMGARDATVKFADFYAQNRDARARADYEALLGDLETTFATRTRALAQNSSADLDVEIQVLRERLAYETPQN